MSVFEFVLAAGIALAAPILWAALGELISEKSGTLNLGIEGVMVLGVFGAAVGFQIFGSPLIGVTIAILLGVLSALILSLLYVYIGADQIVTGILFSMVALGVATVAGAALLTSQQSSSLPEVPIYLLSDIPIIGTALFNQNVLVYLALLMVPVVAFVVNRTWFGLNIKAVGHRARVLETAGLSVRRTRSVALLISCVFVALGGATLALSTASIFQPGTTAGRGYIALVVVVLARWNPWFAALGALLFGAAQSLQFQVQSINWLESVPYQFVLMLPYVVGVIAVVLMRGSRYPASVGIPYRAADAR